MDAPARIKAENWRRGGGKREKDPQSEVGGRGCTDCFREERRSQKEKARERKGWVERKGREEGKTNCLPPPS